MAKPKNVYQERIRQALKETGLSFKAAALSAGIPEHTLRKWVQGIATPKLDQFALLLRVGINEVVPTFWTGFRPS